MDFVCLRTVSSAMSPTLFVLFSSFFLSSRGWSSWFSESDSIDTAYVSSELSYKNKQPSLRKFPHPVSFQTFSSDEFEFSATCRLLIGVVFSHTCLSPASACS